MKALVGAFNQEKALVGAFSVIVQPVVEPIEHYTALISCPPPSTSCHLLCGHELFITTVPGPGEGEAGVQLNSVARATKVYCSVCSGWYIWTRSHSQ